MNKQIKDIDGGFFSFRSIKRKLTWTFLILIAVIIILSVISYYTNLQILTDAQAVRTINAPLTVMVEQVIGYDAMLTGEVHWAILDTINNETDEVEERREAYDEIGAKLDTLLKVDARALINKSRRSLEDKQKVYNILNKLDEINLALVDLELKAFEALKKGDTKTALALTCEGKYYEYKEELSNLYSQWNAEEMRIAEFYRQRLLEHTLQVRNEGFALAIFLILVLLILPILINRKVIKPIKKLTHVAEEISSGDIDIKIPADLKKDKSEIGEIANAFDKLLESSHFALKKFVESKIKNSDIITGKSRRK